MEEKNLLLEAERRIDELMRQNAALAAEVERLSAVQGEPVTMSNDKMREEFDSWIEQQGMSTMKDGETYYHRVTHVAWQAWKASRASLVVELPFEFVNGTMRADQVIDAIEAAGVRVKP